MSGSLLSIFRKTLTRECSSHSQSRRMPSSRTGAKLSVNASRPTSKKDVRVSESEIASRSSSKVTFLESTIRFHTFWREARSMGEMSEKRCRYLGGKVLFRSRSASIILSKPISGLFSIFVPMLRDFDRVNKVLNGDEDHKCQQR